MGISIALALLMSGGHALPVSGAMFWEEPASIQKIPMMFHPMLRFDSWEITRFNRSTTYMFTTPDFIQQGQFARQDSHYLFRAVMANELENADKAILLADGAGRGFDEAYTRSMSNFEGDYQQSTRRLRVSYPVKGMWQFFDLYATTDGDDQRSVLVSGDEVGLVGLWHAPDPHPDKLDARTRNKIELQGLEHFFKDAAASDGALFSILDLRTDKSYRIHATEDRWERLGSTLRLYNDRGHTDFQISADGTKLSANGKPAYVRD